MTLDNTSRLLFQKARHLKSGASRITLDDNECRKLIAIIVRDLDIDDRGLAVTSDLPEFYDPAFSAWSAEGPSGIDAYERLVELVPDGDLFFNCLAKIHLRRLKYQQILAAQPFPTLEQIGPRGLLQYGMAPPSYLATLLFWRKWIYDIDNRAAQETGYIFEPIIAASIGGVPYSDSKSPVRRRSGKGGRQVDCLRGDDAYEVKLRVTIAASGQGRWEAELDFPLDCQESGFRPVLIVFDSTENPKLSALKGAFEDAGGAHYVGQRAWEHLEDLAGETMSVFLDRYVREPLESLLAECPPPDELPPLSLRQEPGYVVFQLGDFEMRIERSPEDADLGDDDEPGIPDDVDDELPGV